MSELILVTHRIFPSLAIVCENHGISPIITYNRLLCENPMPASSPPLFTDDFYAKHALLLCESYQRFLGKPLVTVDLDGPLKALFEASFALVSHGTENDPIFNFGNQTALTLFELTWGEFTALPSRKSAEPINREERQRLLDRVTSHGYIGDYTGIRISSSGKRFLIENAIVWDLVDHLGGYHGQAAVFNKWSFLS